MTTVSDMVVAVHVAMSSAMHAMTTVSDMPTGRERRTSTAGVAYDALSVSQGSATGVGARTSPSAGKGAGAGLGVGSRGAKLKVRRSKTTWWPTVAECHRRSGDRRPPRPRPPRSSSSRCSSASSSPPPSRPLSWLLLTSLRAVWLSLCVAQVEGHSGHRYGDVDYFPPTKFPVVAPTCSPQPTLSAMPSAAPNDNAAMVTALVVLGLVVGVFALVGGLWAMRQRAGAGSKTMSATQVAPSD